jgi:hypothetical protein
VLPHNAFHHSGLLSLGHREECCRVNFAAGDDAQELGIAHILNAASGASIDPFESVLKGNDTHLAFSIAVSIGFRSTIVRTMMMVLSSSDGGGSPGCDAHHRAIAASGSSSFRVNWMTRRVAIGLSEFRAIEAAADVAQGHATDPSAVRWETVRHKSSSLMA